MSSAIDSLGSVITDLKEWAKQPFAPGMGVGGWFLFFGLIVVISAAWAIILHDLKGEL